MQGQNECQWGGKQKMGEEKRPGYFSGRFRDRSRLLSINSRPNLAAMVTGRLLLRMAVVDWRSSVASSVDDRRVVDRSYAYPATCPRGIRDL